MPYSVAQAFSILHPLYSFQPLQKYAKSASARSLRDSPKYHKGLASCGASLKKESIISTSSNHMVLAL